MRTTYFPTLTLTGLMLLTACSSTPRATPVTTTATTAAVAPTTTVPEPTTSTTIVATTTTTEPPPTTTAPDVITTVKQAVFDYQAGRNTCLEDPTTCDPATYARGAHLESERAFVATAVGRRARSRRRVEDPDYWVLSDATVSSDGQTATVVGCHWSTSILEGPGGTTINDDSNSNHATLELRLEEGTWWVTFFSLNRRLANENDCGAQP
jgi:hypothetical protein